MDWLLWMLWLSAIVCITYGRERDEDAELKETFFRLLDYGDDFEDYIRSQRDETYKYAGNHEDRFDPDDDSISNARPKQWHEKRHRARSSKKELLKHLYIDERLRNKENVYKKSDISRPDLHKKTVSKLVNTKSLEYGHNSPHKDVQKSMQHKKSDIHSDIEFRESKDDDSTLQVVKTDTSKGNENTVRDAPKVVEETVDLDAPSKADPAVAAAGSVAPTVKPSALPKSHVETTKKDTSELNDVFFIVIVVACSLACIAGLTLAAYCWYRLRRETKQEEEAEVAPFKGGANSDKKLRRSDEKLAKSAEMYHYVHSKNQLTALHGKDSGKDPSKHEASDSSEDESDNTIYECSGLAPPGDMKVVNPLFADVDSRHSDAKSEGSVSPTRDISLTPPDDAQSDATRRDTQ